jgi:hypothetical protein
MRVRLADVEGRFTAHDRALIWLLAGFVWIVAAGCGDGPRRTIHDLVEEFPPPALRTW